MRIWRPSGCIDMNSSYLISLYLPRSFPLGDNGGGKFLAELLNSGLYLVDYGDIGRDPAIYIADSLLDLLTKAVGIEKTGSGCTNVM